MSDLFLCFPLRPAAPQVSEAMSDSTASSTTANDLDLIYLKGIMENPLVRRRSSLFLSVCDQ